MSDKPDGSVIISTQLDTSGIEKSIDKIKGSLDGLAKHLQDKTASITKSISGIEHSLSESGKEVQETSEKIEASMQDIADATDKTADKSEKRITKLTQKVKDEVKKASDSVKSNVDYAVGGGKDGLAGRMMAISDSAAMKVKPMLPTEISPIPIQYRLTAKAVIKLGTALADMMRKSREANTAIMENTKTTDVAADEAVDYADALRAANEELSKMSPGETMHFQRKLSNGRIFDFRGKAGSGGSDNRDEEDTEAEDPFRDAGKSAEAATVKIRVLSKTRAALERSFSRMTKIITKPFSLLGKALSGVTKTIGILKRGAAWFLNFFGEIGQDIEGVLFLFGGAGFLGQLTELGSNLSEVQNVVDVTFEEMAADIDAFAKSAMDAYGLSETMAKKFAGTYGAMAKSFGFTTEEAANLSKALTAMSGDVASFYNLDQEEAFNKLKGVLTGETEGLKSLGVTMTQAALEEYALSRGIKKAVKDMTEQEKVALRFNYVMNKLSDASGDFTRTQEGWANQTRILKLQFESIMASIGQGFINLWTPILNFFNRVLSGLALVAEAFRKFTAQISGGEESTSGAGAAAMAAGEAMGYLNEETEENAEATEEAEKKNKKFLSGLDEIKRWDDGNKDKDDSDGKLPIDPFTGLGDADGEGKKHKILDGLADGLDKLAKRAKELAKLFETGFRLELKDGGAEERIGRIRDNLRGIKDKLSEIYNDPAVREAAKRFGDSWAYNLGRVAGSLVNVGLGIAELFTGGINQFLERKASDIKEHLIKMFDIGSEIATMIGSFFSSIADILSPIWGPLGQNILADALSIAYDIGSAILETALKLGRDVINFFVRPFTENREALKSAVEATLEAITPAIDGLVTLASNIKKDITELYDNHLKPFFDKVTNTATRVVGAIAKGYTDHVAPKLKALSERVKKISEGPLSDLISNVTGLIGDLIDELGKLWDEFADPAFMWLSENLMPFLGELIGSLGGALLTAFEAVIGKLDDLVTWCRENPAVIETMATAIASLFAGWCVMKTATVIAAIAKAFQGFTILDSIAWTIRKVTSLGGALVTALGGPWAIAIAAVIFLAIEIYRHWDDIKKFIDEKLMPLVDKAKEQWEKFCEAVKQWYDNNIQPVLDAAKAGWENLCNSVKNFYDEKVSPVVTLIKEGFVAAIDIWKDKFDAIKGKIEAFREAWVLAWQIVKDKFLEFAQPILDTIAKISDAVKGAIEAFGNLLLAGQAAAPNDPNQQAYVNDLALLPGFDTSLLPMHATGAVIPPNSPYLAILGDQKRGTNVEAPLATIEQAVTNALQRNGGNRNGANRITVVIDRKVLFDAVIDAGRDTLIRTGNNAFEMG